MVKPVPEGLSIRPCFWPVGSRAYPRSGVGFFVRTKFEVLGQDSQTAGVCRRSCPKTVLRQPSSLPVALPFPLSSMGDMSLAVSFALPCFDSVNVLHDSSKEGSIVLFLGGF